MRFGLAFEPSIGPGQEASPRFDQVRQIEHRAVADRIGILQEIAREPRLSQKIADIRPTADMQCPKVGIDHATISPSGQTTQRRPVWTAARGAYNMPYHGLFSHSSGPHCLPEGPGSQTREQAGQTHGGAQHQGNAASPTWLKVLPQGLFCEPGGFFIDPLRAVDRAVITHAHSDHARPGHRAVLATADTLALMRARLGRGRAPARRSRRLAGANRSPSATCGSGCSPAGHVLGSAQVAMDYRGTRAVVSGDYKRTPDPTCARVRADRLRCVRHRGDVRAAGVRPSAAGRGDRQLLDSVALFPERTHVVGCYALGKCQRLIALLRQAGWDRPIWLHGALAAMCEVYRSAGVGAGRVAAGDGRRRRALAGAIVLAPPGAVADRWARRLADPVVALASGWMRVRQRAKSRGVELPLVISDHADWNELNATMDEVGAPEVWVTHGREDALIHAAGQRGIKGRALRLVGYGEEDEAENASLNIVGVRTLRKAPHNRPLHGHCRVTGLSSLTNNMGRVGRRRSLVQPRQITEAKYDRTPLIHIR